MKRCMLMMLVMLSLACGCATGETLRLPDALKVIGDAADYDDPDVDERVMPFRGRFGAVKRIDEYTYDLMVTEYENGSHADYPIDTGMVGVGDRCRIYLPGARAADILSLEDVFFASNEYRLVEVDTTDFYVFCDFTSCQGFIGGAPGYEDFYESAIDEARAQYEQAVRDGEIDEEYGGLYYTFSDITGDGYPELIVEQVYGKFDAHYSVYGSDGVESVYMGTFDADREGGATRLYAYRGGVLALYVRKADVDLCLYRWDGSGFVKKVLYANDDRPDDQWDEEYTIEDFRAYYDQTRLIEQIVFPH